MLSALIFLITTLADLYLLTFLLRFIMQWVRASHYNPLSQFVFKVTNPLVVPARRLLPSVGGIDVPTLAVLFVLELIVTFALLRLTGLSVTLPDLLLLALLRLVSLTLLLYIGALFIYVLLSWFGDRGRNPMGELLADLVEPLLRPVRRLLPPIGGLDIAPLIVTLVLYAIRIALPFPIAYLR
jgi:YggT family protein